MDETLLLGGRRDQRACVDTDAAWWKNDPHIAYTSGWVESANCELKVEPMAAQNASGVASP